MRTTCRTPSARALTLFVIALGASILAPALAPPRALAGTYTVTACEAASDGHANNSWYQGASGGFFTAMGCPNDGAGNRQGMVAMSGLNVNIGNLPLSSVGYTRFDAPPGTTIAGVRLTYDGESRFPGAGWSSYIASSDDGFQGTLGAGNPHFDFLDGCNAYAFCSAYGGATNGIWGSGSDHYWDLPGGTTSVSATIGCEAGGGCPSGSNGAYVAVHGAAVTLEDDVAPTMTSFRGLWGDTSWAHGVRYVGFDATDVSGVKVAAIEIDPATPHAMTAAAETRACDYTFAVPCERRGIATDFDTSRVSDGTHTLRFATEDAAGNWNTADTTIHVDNSPPGRPSLTLDGGETWHTTKQWTMRWNTPQGQVSDVTGTHWKVCPNDGGSCWTIDSTLSPGGSGLSGGANARTDDLGITQPGDYTAQLYLSDAAGNADPNAASDPIHLKFDNVAPGDAEPAHANGWLNAQEAASYPEPIALKAGATVPVSGVAGYAVTVDDDPGSAIDVSATANQATYLLSDLTEGHNSVKARAVSGAGYASANVQSVDIPVDKTPPSVAVQGAPDATVWQAHDVPLTFSGTDQPNLSGMGAAGIQQPVTAGAYIGYSVDGGPEQHVRGDTALATIASDGVHHVTYEAHDLAGNPSTSHSVDVRVDKTAPEFVAFESQDPSDPARVSVAASDRTSGLADGGVIQLRLVTPAQLKQAFRNNGPTGCSAKLETPRCKVVRPSAQKELDAAAAGNWRSLPTGRSGDHYTAEITPAAAPTAGTYEFRATVPDQAGNQTVATTNREGRTVELFIDPAKLGDGGSGGSGGSGTTGGASVAVHCFGCPSYPGASVPTKLTAGLVKPAAKKARKKTTKKRARGAARAAASKRKRRKKAPSRPQRREQLVSSLLLRFGKSALAKGTLRYDSGQPIPAATVDVYVQLDAAGSKWTHVAAVRTDAGGAFSYRVPAGPSRAMGFRYDGNARDKAAEAKVSVKVRAATSIKAGRRSLRLRQTLTLSGRLVRLGAPVPAAGKLIVLEAFDRRRWRKFATVRTTKAGAWRYRYRFEATRGTVIYPMRAVVERDSSYAFETGKSRTVHVKVRGR